LAACLDVQAQGFKLFIGPKRALSIGSYMVLDPLRIEGDSQHPAIVPIDHR
jgi:hypothetical protein